MKMMLKIILAIIRPDSAEAEAKDARAISKLELLREEAMDLRIILMSLAILLNILQKGENRSLLV